ncbi:MAG: hypothetical protein IJ504_00440 [Bacteroidales bacterium]|nr:hypothetical protein [Bacteroidales bacterium]
MAKVLTLKFVDGSYKECEVTGRIMGGENVYYRPLSSLTKGCIGWDSGAEPDHNVYVLEVGEDYVVVEVKGWGREKTGPYTLYEGVEKRYSYMFGEWSYHFSVSLVRMDV